jgi:hypothetical protein
MVLMDRAARPLLGAGLALGIAMITGCGGGGGSSSGGPVGASNPGTVRIMLADAPVTGVTAVNVTFSKIEGLYDGEADSRTREDDDHTAPSVPDSEQDDNDQWVTLVSQSVTVNLLDFANKPLSALFGLVNASVPSGHYKKFRFTIDTAVVDINGTQFTPTLEHNPVVVDSECFVSPHENEVLVVDFDVAESLSGANGSFQFDPHLRLAQGDHSGSVSGTVQFTSAQSVPKGEGTVALVDAGGNVVAESEVEVEDATTGGTTATANFTIHAVPPGTYTLRVTGDEGFQGTVSAPVTVTVGPGQVVQGVQATLSQ